MSTHELRTIAALIGAAALIAPLTIAQAQDTTSVTRDTAAPRQSASDTTRQDSTVWGYSPDTAAAVQNPPGYRGMERDTTVFPPQGDSAYAADQTGRIEQRARQDTLGSAEGKNPPGYRGMERPAGLDSAAQRADTAAAKTDTAAAKTDTAAAKADTTAAKADTAAAKADTVAAKTDTVAAKTDTVAAKADTVAARKATTKKPHKATTKKRPTSQKAAKGVGVAADTSADSTAMNRNQPRLQDSTSAAADDTTTGSRGMERPAALDSTARESDTTNAQ